jgi:hypothetical protein
MKDGPTIPFETEQNTSCYFITKPDCPIKGFTWFWKAACICIVVLLVCCSLTIWMMALTLSRYSTELHEVRSLMVTGQDALGVKIDGHKQLTMENRVVTSEIRGMLSSQIEERKNSSKKGNR